MENEQAKEFQRSVRIESGFALILARGGSKSIKKKNIILLNEKPLISYTIEAAQKCGHFSSIFVSTDDEEIADVARAFGAEVIFRPKDLATDTTSSYESAVHAIYLINRTNSFTWFALLQPTSPLRNEKHISECMQLFLLNPTESAISVCEAATHPFKMFLLKNEKVQYVRSKLDLEKPRQLLPKAYKINGAIYINSVKEFLQNRSFISENFSPYVMDKYVSVDIDDLEDLRSAAYYLREGLV